MFQLNYSYVKELGFCVYRQINFAKYFYYEFPIMAHYGGNMSYV